MREIMFRGKRLDNGEWVYGYYVYYGFKDNQKHYIVPDYASALYAFEVYPSTVGQCTGQKDIDGVEIYEGDILKILGEEGMWWKEKVVWDDSMLTFGVCTNGVSSEPLSDLEHEDIEVIGNIYVNPELLVK